MVYVNRHIYFYRLMHVYIQTCTHYIFLEKLNMIIYLMLTMTSRIENYTGKVVEFALENYLNGLLCFFICKSSRYPDDQPT